MEERQCSQEDKERSTERLKQKGSRIYKRKQLEEAIHLYMQVLSFSPSKMVALTNVAQCFLCLGQLDDYCDRTWYIDAEALFRRAAAYHLKEAADDMQRAFQLDEANPDVAKQHSIIVGDYEDSVANSELEEELEQQRSVFCPSVSVGGSGGDTENIANENFDPRNPSGCCGNSFRIYLAEAITIRQGIVW